MAIGVNINGQIRNAYVYPSSVHFSFPSPGARGTGDCLLKVVDGSGYKPLIGQDISFYDGLVRVFGGSIEDIVTRRIGATGFSYEITAVSNERKLDKRTVKAVFKDTTAGDIVQKVLDTTLLGEAIGVGNIQPGADIALQPYPTVVASAVYDDLAKRSNFVWYLDPDSQLFFVPRDTTAAPFTLTGADVIYSSMAIKESRSDFRDVELFRVAESAGVQTTDEFPGDGAATAFDLSAPAQSIVSMKVDGVDVSFGPNDSTGSDWYWTPSDTGIFQDSAGAVLAVGQTLTVVFHGVGADVVRVADDAVIADRGAVEGTTGIYEHITEDLTITDVSLATQIAQSILDAYKSIPTVIECETRRFGLRPGMLVHVNIAMPPVTGDFLVNSFDGHYYPNEEHFRYKLELISSTRIGTWVQWWEDIGKKGSSSSSSGAAKANSQVIITYVDSPYTMTGLIQNVYCDCSDGDIQITLATKNQFTLDKYLIAKIDNGPNVVTVLTSHDETIAGASSVTISVQMDPNGNGVFEFQPQH